MRRFVVVLMTLVTACVYEAPMLRPGGHGTGDTSGRTGGEAAAADAGDAIAPADSVEPVGDPGVGDTAGGDPWIGDPGTGDYSGSGDPGTGDYGSGDPGYYGDPFSGDPGIGDPFAGDFGDPFVGDPLAGDFGDPGLGDPFAGDFGDPSGGDPFGAQADAMALGAIVVINEIYTDGDDFVEFYNAGNVTASMTGWYMTDQDGLAHQMVFDPGTQIPPGSHLLICRDTAKVANVPECAGTQRFTFGFAKDGDDVRLHDNLDSLIDNRDWNADWGPGLSYGRSPDGGAWAILDPITPDAPNP